MDEEELDHVSLLRKQAEEFASGKESGDRFVSAIDRDGLLHELEVHQIELEMQNEELRQAQRKLQASRDRYTDLFESAPVGYFTLDRHFYIVEANLTGSRMLSVERHNLIGKRLSEFVLPEHQNTFHRFFRARHSKSRKGCELEMRGKAGTPFFAELQITKESDPESPASYRVVLTDVTKRKRVEETVRQNRDELQAIYDDMQDGLLIADIKTRRFVKTNPAMSRMLGYSKDELLSMSVMQIHPPIVAHKMLEIFQAASKGRLHSMEDAPLLRKDGTVIHAHIAGNLIVYDGRPCMIGLFHDITARKQAEEAVQQSREDLARAQAVGQTGWWRMDVRNDTLTWSDENHRIFGLSKEAPLTYKAFLATVHPDDRNYVDTMWNASLRGSPYDIEHRIVVGDRVKWVREKAYLEYDDAGELLGGFGITQDISSRKEMEYELKRSRDELELRVEERTRELTQTVRALHEQSEQLRQLTTQLNLTEQRERRRLAQILHDHIQQLVVAARMQVNWMGEHQNIKAEQLQETLETTTAILDEAIEAARSLTIDLYPPVLQEAGLISALGWLASRMRKKHRFTIDLHADDGAEPSSDDLRFLLFECARELLLNVVKHSGVQKANVELVRTDDSKIKLIVRDSGKGFDTLLIAKRAQEDGTFGLFSIQQRIEHLVGRMEIETESGRGTEVALTVPASKREPSPAEQLEAKPEMGDSNITDVIRKPATCRIIVVDDHEVVREGLVRIIKSYPDIEIVGKAADGPQAIELAEKLKPDVVLMDVSLGEMSGIEATRRIVETNPHIKVVGLSMSTDNEVSKAMCEAGAVAHLTKSTAAAELVETIRRCARKATS